METISKDQSTQEYNIDFISTQGQGRKEPAGTR